MHAGLCGVGSAQTTAFSFWNPSPVALNVDHDWE